MKKPLRKEDLTIEQKLGMVLCAAVFHGEADDEYVIERIRERKCGAVWVNPGKGKEFIDRFVEAADYPLIVICDAETGAVGSKIPQQISMTAAGAHDEDAYAFGYATAARLRQLGYTAVCNPVVDICKENTPCGHTTRTYGGDVEVVTRLSKAVARGMHDAGILAVAKHYPGGSVGLPYDTHMREDLSPLTAEELKAEHLRPYIELAREGLIDGVMAGHRRFPAIDDKYPACLSRPTLDLLREEGFRGFYISDALCMMGIVLKYGYEEPSAMAVAAGCDLPLPWEISYERAYEGMLDCYRRGIVTEAQVDECLDRILEAQAKIARLPAAPEIPPEYTERCSALFKTSIAAVCGEGVSPAISRDGRHLFILATDGSTSLKEGEYLPGPGEWFRPPEIAKMIRELFPNSEVSAMPQYPSVQDTMRHFSMQTKYDDVVFITYGVTSAYIGPEHMTSRLVAFMDALQSTDRIVAHLYFGNPFMAEDAPYVPRLIMGYTSLLSVEPALRILAGLEEPVGRLPYELNLHKKGDIIYR